VGFITYKKFWTEEYTKPDKFSRIHGEDPSQVVVEFTQFLKKDGNYSLVVDVGCGKGRNSIYLAREGFNVVGIDFVPYAIGVAKERALKTGLTPSNPKFVVHDITETWPVEDSSVDAVIDCNASNDLSSSERGFYLDNLYTALRNGGKLLVYLLSLPENTEGTLIETNPGPESNTVYIPGTNKAEKWYTEEEILQEYDRYRKVSLRRRTSYEIVNGKKIDVLLWEGVFEKQ
jgi:SAM-dependent methyltransferase